ncbi:MAG: DUF3052 domain-containing protein [bacterium]
MAGDSKTPLAKKLGIKPGFRLRRVNPPPELDDWLAPLPEGVTDAPLSKGEADVILFFTDSASELKGSIAGLNHSLHPDGGLWVCWPKKASKAPTDLNDGVVREVGLATGLVDNKVCAVSEVWSALRFVYRLEDRLKAANR